MIKYPEEFIAKAKRLYPRNTQLHKLLDEGSYFVGSVLRDSKPVGTIPIATVLAAKSLKELKKHANMELERAELYCEWYDIYNAYQAQKKQQKLAEIEAAHAIGVVLT